MKRKFFYLVAGTLALTACTSEEVLDDSSVQRKAIGFENVVNKLTRAVTGSEDITADNLEKFRVFGYYTITPEGTGSAVTVPVFEDAKVTKDGNIWKPETERYWVPGATYKFYAYSCGDLSCVKDGGNTFSMGGESATSFQITDYVCNNDHQHDLVFAESTEIVGKDPVKNEQNENVALTFKHILSKVGVTFTNSFPGDYTLDISDVSISGIKTKGGFNGTEWTTATTTIEENSSVDLSGAEGIKVTETSTSTPVFVIPNVYTETEKVTIAFDVAVKYGDAVVLTRHMEGKWSPNWEMGKIYTYNVEISGSTTNLEAIAFEAKVGVDGWEKGEDTAEITFSATNAN